MRSHLGIPPDAFVIGHVGRFDHQKNHVFLLDIFSDIVKLDSDVFLVLVGDGKLRPEIERRVTARRLWERVLFLGSRTDVPHLMQSAMDVFLFPSFFEGLGLVLIEAQAAGLPCIISDAVTEEADIVKPLIRRIGLDQPSAIWARALKDLKSSVRPRFEALRVVEGSPFTIEASVSKLAEIYSA